MGDSDMSTNTQEELIKMVESIVADLENAVELISDSSCEHAEKWLKSMGVDVEGITFPSHPAWENESDTDEDAIREAAERYLDDVLSIEGIWKGGSKGNAWYRGCEVLITCGGPDIRLDTATGYVTGRWGGDEVTRSVDSSVCDYYDQMMEG
jgi:hypothetical protein